MARGWECQVKTRNRHGIKKHFALVRARQTIAPRCGARTANMRSPQDCRILGRKSRRHPHGFGNSLELAYSSRQLDCSNEKGGGEIEFAQFSWEFLFPPFIE